MVGILFAEILQSYPDTLSSEESVGGLKCDSSDDPGNERESLNGTVLLFWVQIQKNYKG